MLYVGVTSDLAVRMMQHREGTGSAFYRRYGLKRLVLAERHDRIKDAIAREGVEGVAARLEGPVD